MPIGKIEHFEVGTHNWDAYCRRIKQFITLNGIGRELHVATLVTHVGVTCYELMCDLCAPDLPETTLVTHVGVTCYELMCDLCAPDLPETTLVTHVGVTCYELMCDLCAPDLPETETFEDLERIVKEHLEPKRSEIAERHVFRQRKQGEAETVNDYLQSLKHLAKTCNFGNTLEINLRDQFVSGLHLEDMRSSLFAERELDYKRAVELALALEAADRHAATVASGVTSGPDTAPPSESMHRVAAAAESRRAPASMSKARIAIAAGPSKDASGRERACTRCGRSGHPPARCRFRAYHCDQCGVKGHLKAMCRKYSSDCATESNNTKDKTIGFRHVQVFFMFSALLISFTMRINMSIAIVAMTDKTDPNAFPWNMQTQSVILSSFLWGYIILQIPAGEMASKYGGKLIIASCIGSNAVLVFLVPPLSHAGGWEAVCAVRFLQGLVQGVLYPTLHCLISNWVPLKEKSRLGMIVYGGSHLGTSLQLMVSGFIIDFWGWPAVFYINGMTGTVWVLSYMYFGADSPEKSKIISKEERHFIQTSLGQIGGQKNYKTPWKTICTSLPFLALLITHCGHNWGFWTLVMEMPSYYKQVLDVDIKSNGVMSAIPYLTLFIISYPFGFISDYAVKKGVSVNVCRKVCESIGKYGPGLALIGLCYVPPNNVPLAVFLLTAIVGLNAGHLAGFLLVHIDMAPNFAGTMIGITNVFASSAGIVAPLAAGAILTDETDPILWHTVFYLASGIYIGTNTFFLIFGTANRQKWNEPELAE